MIGFLTLTCRLCGGSFVCADSRIVLGEKPATIEKHAARELGKYLTEIYSKSPKTSPILKKNCIVLGTPKSNRTVAALVLAGKLKLPENPQGFIIAPMVSGPKTFTVIASRGSAGVLYGVYDLLEEMGVRFLCEGDDVIPKPGRFELKRAIRESPAFAKRGFPWKFFGPGNLKEAKIVLDWMARHRLNLLRLHRVPFPLLVCQTKSPQHDGKLVISAHVRRNQAAFRELIDYAQARGIKIFYRLLCPHVSKTDEYAKEFFAAFPEIEDLMLPKFLGKFYYLSGKTGREEKYRPQKIAEGLKVYQKAIDRVKPGVTSWIYIWGGALPAETYPAARKFGHISTWNFYGDWDPDKDMPTLDKLMPKGIGLYLKDSHGDYGFTDPPCPWIWKIKKHPTMAVFASSAEYGGQGSLYYTKFNLWIPEFRLFAKHRIQAVSLRRSLYLPGAGPMFKRYGLKVFLVNDLAYAMLAWNPQTTEKQVWCYWVSRYFPKAADEITQVLENSEEIVVNSLYLNGLFISRGITKIQKLDGLWSSPWRRKKWFGMGRNGKDFPEGKSIPPDLLRKSMKKMMAEKDRAVSMAGGRLKTLEKHTSKFSPKDYSALKRMLAEDKIIVEIYRDHVHAYYLYRIIKNTPDANHTADRKELAAIAGRMRRLAEQLAAPEVRNDRCRFNKSVMRREICGITRFYEKFCYPDKKRITYTFSPAKHPEIVSNFERSGREWFQTDKKLHYVHKDNLWGIYRKKDQWSLCAGGKKENCPKLRIVCPVKNGRYFVYLHMGRSLNISFDGKKWFRRHGSMSPYAFELVNVRDGRFVIYVDDGVTASNAYLVSITLEKHEQEKQ